MKSQGPGHCEAGILCRSRTYQYHREAATLRDELSQVLQELNYNITPEMSQNIEKDITLPKIEKELVEKYLNELEKAKNEYVY